MNRASIMTAGFPCKDFSVMNTNRQIVVHGKSAQTLQDTLNYMEATQPTVNYYENAPWPCCYTSYCNESEEAQRPGVPKALQGPPFNSRLLCKRSLLSPTGRAKESKGCPPPKNPMGVGCQKDLGDNTGGHWSGIVCVNSCKLFCPA